MKKLSLYIFLILTLCNAGFAESEKAIIKCADYAYKDDFNKNFFKYMHTFVHSKTEVEKLELMGDDSNFLFQQILHLSEAGFSKKEISEHYQEIEKKDFESLEETHKRAAISIKQNKDKFTKNLDNFFLQSSMNKRKDNIYTRFFLTCESQSKKDKDSFLEKWK